MKQIRIAPVLLFILSVAALTPAAVSGEREALPFQLRSDLESVLEREADRLWQEKNEEGLRFQRGSYAKRFEKVDEGTYVGAFFKDTASADRLRTELYHVTLKGTGSKWEIADQELMGSYEKMIRGVPNDETFHRFDSFEFEYEGMTISAGAGSLVIDYLLGEPSSLLLTGDGLNWEYDPPADLGGEQGQVWARLKEKDPGRFAFGSEGIIIECDPQTCERFLDEKFDGLKEATRDDLDKDLADFYGRELNKQVNSRRDNPFRGFDLPLEEGERFYRANIKQRGKDEWIVMSFDTRDAREVTIWASGYGQVIGYSSKATRNSNIDPYEIEIREDRGARRYDVVAIDGRVQVGLESSELLRGDIDYTIHLKQDAQEIPFRLASLDDFSDSDLATGITVNSIESENGEPMVFVKTGPTSGMVILPEPLPAGSDVTFNMEYETTGSLRKYTSSFAYMERGAWLPFVRYTNKIKTFKLEVKSPSKYKTLGVGSLISEETSGDVSTTVWGGADIWFPTIIFGRYIDASPKSKAVKSDGTEIAVMVYMDNDSRAEYEVPLKNLAPLGAQAVNALNIYRELFGVDYPHAKLDLVNSPTGLSAQAPDSIVYVGTPAFLSAARLGGDQSTSEFLNTLIAHEVAHQWWGGVVGFKNRRHYWFVESLAEYASAIYAEIVESDGYKKPEKGRKAYLNMVDGWRKSILETDLLNSVQNSEVAYLGEFRGMARQALIYNKGPYAFHILRETFGDEKFFAFLKALAVELQGQNVVTRDIQRVAEQSFGGTMEWFFDQWIRGVGIPVYQFDYTYRQAEDGSYLIEGNINQKVVAGLEKFPLDGVYYRGKVPVSVRAKGGQAYRKDLIVQGPDTPLGLKVPAKPMEVVFNEEGEILSWPVVVKDD